MNKFENLNRFMNFLRMNQTHESNTLIVNEYDELLNLLSSIVTTSQELKKYSEKYRNYLVELSDLVKVIEKEFDNIPFNDPKYPQIEGKYQGLCMALSLLDLAKEDL